MPELPPLPMLCKKPEHDGHLLKENGSVLLFLLQDNTANLTPHYGCPAELFYKRITKCKIILLLVSLSSKPFGLASNLPAAALRV